MSTRSATCARTTKVSTITRTSTFLALPVELRNRIYELTIDVSLPIVPTDPVELRIDRRYKDRARTAYVRCLGLVHACEQTRADTKLLLAARAEYHEACSVREFARNGLTVKEK